MKKRLFIGVKIEASPELTSLTEKLKNIFGNSDITWVVAGNLHITLMFLGDVGSEMIPDIIHKLKTIEFSSFPFEATLENLGKFSKNRQTNVIWIGYKDEGQLENLAGKVNVKMLELGFKPDQRSFKAHLTLGRVKRKIDENLLNSLIHKYQNLQFQNFKVSEFILFESILKQEGPIYMQIDRIKL